MKISTHVFVAALCIALFSSAASAVTPIYSNIGAGFPGDSPTGYNTGAIYFGTTFTATASGALSSLEIDLKSGASTPFTIGLYTSSSGQPGTLLESWSATGPTGLGPPAPPLTVLTSVANPLVSSGTQYWVVLTQARSQIIWWANDTGVNGGVWVGDTLTGLVEVFQNFETPAIQLNSVALVTSVYISDTQNQRIRKVVSGLISTVAGNGIAGFSGDGGPATSAQLHNPYGIAATILGDVYIADTLNNRIRLVHNGIISTVAGNGAPSFSGDGGPATSAGLNNPTGVAVDDAGNLYIADQRNNRIRKVSGGVITTIAGNGGVGFSGDGGPPTSAQLYYPTSVEVSGSFIAIADTNNNRIRFISGGTINTLIGNGSVGFSCNGFGTATNVPLHNPTGIALLNTGIFVADYGDQCIREDVAGLVSKVAGNGLASYSGDGGPPVSAALNYPTGVAAEPSGTFYISDYVNHRIRIVNGGTINTFAGTGVPGFSGDGGPATQAQLYNPMAVAVALTAPATVP